MEDTGNFMNPFDVAADTVGLILFVFIGYLMLCMIFEGVKSEDEVINANIAPKRAKRPL